MAHVVHNTREVKNLNIVYCCSFSSRMVNKMVDFCYETSLCYAVGSTSKYMRKTKERRRLNTL